MLVGEERLEAGLGQFGRRSGPITITTTLCGGTDDELREVGLPQRPAALGTVAGRAEVGEGALLAEDAVASRQVARRGEGFGASVAGQDLRGSDCAGIAGGATGAGFAGGRTGGDG